MVRLYHAPDPDPSERISQGLQQGIQAFLGVQASRRANRQDVRDEEDRGFWRERHEQSMRAGEQAMQHGAAAEQRAQEDQGFQREQADWIRKRREQERDEDEAAKQGMASFWRAAFGEEPPDAIYGPPAPGSDVDLRSEIPTDLQRMLRAVGPEVAKMAPADAQRILGQARYAVADEVYKRRRDSVKSLAQMLASEGPPAPDGGEAQPGLLTPQQMMDVHAALDRGEDPDAVEASLHKVVRAHSQQLADAEMLQDSLMRIDGAFAQAGELGAALSSFGVSMDPAKFAEARVLRHQLAALKPRGAALAEAERRIIGLMFGGMDRGGGSSRSSARGNGLSEDRAFQTWSKLPDDQRTTEKLAEIEDAQGYRDRQSENRARGGMDPVTDYGGGGTSADSPRTFERNVRERRAEAERMLAEGATVEEAAAFMETGASPSAGRERPSVPVRGLTGAQPDASDEQRRGTTDRLGPRPTGGAPFAPGGVRRKESAQAPTKAEPRFIRAPTKPNSSSVGYVGTTEEDAQDILLDLADQARHEANPRRKPHPDDHGADDLEQAIAEYEDAFGQVPAEIRRKIQNARVGGGR